MFTLLFILIALPVAAIAILTGYELLTRWIDSLRAWSDSWKTLELNGVRYTRSFRLAGYRRSGYSVTKIDGHLKLRVACPSNYVLNLGPANGLEHLQHTLRGLWTATDEAVATQAILDATTNLAFAGCKEIRLEQGYLQASWRDPTLSDAQSIEAKAVNALSEIARMLPTQDGGAQPVMRAEATEVNALRSYYRSRVLLLLATLSLVALPLVETQVMPVRPEVTWTLAAGIGLSLWALFTWACLRHLRGLTYPRAYLFWTLCFALVSAVPASWVALMTINDNGDSAVAQRHLAFTSAVGSSTALEFVDWEAPDRTLHLRCLDGPEARWAVGPGTALHVHTRRGRLAIEWLVDCELAGPAEQLPESN